MVPASGATYPQNMANRKAHEDRIAKQARKIAETGRHNGWFYIACELRRQGEPLALNVLEREPYRSELDKKYTEVRRRMYGAPLPKGPKGEKRPADVIAAAVTVMKIAAGEIKEQTNPLPRSAAAELGSRGGKARAAGMSNARRSEIAKKAAQSRWREE
jgi:hypothetical protein